MTQRNDGGSAFPVPGLSGLTNGQWMDPMPGMSLRDAMALSARMPDDYSVQWAEVLAGEKAPMPVDGKAAPIDQRIDFWMRAEAAYRYRLADAMLAARERT